MDTSAVRAFRGASLFFVEAVAAVPRDRYEQPWSEEWRVLDLIGHGNRSNLLPVEYYERPVGTPFGARSLDSYLPSRTAELVVHGLDLDTSIEPPAAVLADCAAFLVSQAVRGGRGVDVVRALSGRHAGAWIQRLLRKARRGGFLSRRSAAAREGRVSRLWVYARWVLLRVGANPEMVKVTMS